MQKANHATISPFRGKRDFWASFFGGNRGFPGGYTAALANLHIAFYFRLKSEPYRLASALEPGAAMLNNVLCSRRVVRTLLLILALGLLALGVLGNELDLTRIESGTL